MEGGGKELLTLCVAARFFKLSVPLRLHHEFQTPVVFPENPICPRCSNQSYELDTLQWLVTYSPTCFQFIPKRYVPFGDQHVSPICFSMLTVLICLNIQKRCVVNSDPITLVILAAE